MEDKDKLKTKTKTNQGKDKDKDNLHGIGKLKPGGGVLLGDSQLHPHQEDSVGGGGGSGLFLIVTLL